jgi:hypothetical protein
MNIFRLDEDPATCAEYHCDKHVVKMIIEYAQLLSTAHRLCDGFEGFGASKSGERQVRVWTIHDSRDDVLYKATHVNHPSNMWTRLHKENYVWLLELWLRLCEEYTKRYGKTHLTFTKLHKDLCKIPDYIDKGLNATAFPLCMPDDCKKGDAVTSYRNFYKAHKREFATWKNSIPAWFN